MSFVHLSVFSEFSIVKGMLRIPALLDAVQAMGMPAIALTDHCNLFATVKFFRAAVQRGIKPIIGCEVWVAWPDQAHPSRILLWCQDYQGYQNLSALLSKGYHAGMDDRSRIILPFCQLTASDLQGLIVGVGGVGCLGRQGQTDLMQSILQGWQEKCPNRVVMCVQSIGHSGESEANLQLMKVAALETVPVIAVNDVCFLTAADFEAHEARICIERGQVLADQNRGQDFYASQYLTRVEDMQAKFKAWPQVIENTVTLARRCNVWFEFGEHFLPDFPIPETQTMPDYFSHAAKNGLQSRFEAALSGVAEKDRAAYFQRLQMECKVITQMGFCGYFLIVADFIRWSKSAGVPVGPGRGSGAGSLVAYALEITDVDPIAYGLLFERFLNPERVSMPDFDIDFCMDGRDRVIDYVAQRYGRENVSQIVTFGTMAARAVVRDVGRVLSLPYGMVDQLAKLVPMDLGMTLTKALQQESQLADRYRSESEVSTLIDLALKLEGITRGVGKHAGGVVIAPAPLHTFTPIYRDAPEGSVLSQFDKDDIETIGLVKFDFLGLRTLTIIDWTVQMIRQRHADAKDFDIARINMQDSATFKLLQACETTAVFQLESRGMKDLIKRLQPDQFEEIVALVALFRPGPLQAGMVDDFIDRKHGRAAVSYMHADLEEILKPTYGVILYQEQVMQIAQVLSGYTLGGADLLRRAMGKKKPEEMAKQRAIFVNGAVEQGHAAKEATKIFDLIEKFAGYGFNKSHSVAYALLSYQTAWLKAHYPAEFMACALSSDMDNTDKVLVMLQAAEAIGLTVLPPDVNQSVYRFTVPDNKVIRYGLGAIKGMGEALAQALVKSRQTDGPYTDLRDIVQRLIQYKLNRKSLECLIKSGALDTIIPHRHAAMASIDAALGQAEQTRRDLLQGQTSLFASLAAEEAGGVKSAFQYAPVAAWDDLQQLREEKATLGLYLSGHPVRSIRLALTTAHVTKIQTLSADSNGFIAGLITQFRVMQGRRGQPMAFVTIEDESAQIDVALFGDAYTHYRQYLVKDQTVMVRGQISVDQFSQGLRLQVDWMLPWTTFLAQEAKWCQLSVRSDDLTPSTMQTIQNIIQQAGPGPAQLLFYYQQENAATTMQAGAAWSFTPTETVIQKLSELQAINVVTISFAKAMPK